MRQYFVIWRIAPFGFWDAPWRSQLRHFGAYAPNLASLVRKKPNSTRFFKFLRVFVCEFFCKGRDSWRKKIPSFFFFNVKFLVNVFYNLCWAFYSTNTPIMLNLKIIKPESFASQVSLLKCRQLQYMHIFSLSSQALLLSLSCSLFWLRVQRS